MKLFRKFAALFLAVLLLSTMAMTALATETEGTEPAGEEEVIVNFIPVDEIVYTTTDVNVRTGPGLNYHILTTIAQGKTVHRIGIGDNGWSKVVVDGVEAYMFSAYLTTTEPGTFDSSRLTYQLAIVNGLNQAEYTKESWAALMEVVAKAEKVLKGFSQAEVDITVRELEAAIAALVKMNYTGLNTALADVRRFLESSEAAAKWGQLMDAIDKGEALLGGGDQAAVDAAAENIRKLLEEVKDLMDAQQEPQIIVQEVPVEVPPTDDYCNIPVHRLWPILFFVSLALNLVLGGMILVYVARKRKNQTDDTPLVDYDISDDTW